MAAEKIAGALVSTFVERTIDNLASRFVDIFRGNKSNKKQLSNLKVKLLAVDAVADDAEQKQFTDPHVRDWLLAAKDVMLDTEDLLEEIDYALSKSQVEAESHSSTKKVRNSLKSSFVSFFKNEIESTMEELIKNLEYLATQSHVLGLKKADDVGVRSGSGSKLRSTYLPNESVIYGRDDDKEFVFNWLTSDIPNNLSILSIVGMGGLGKTTLAQHVFNDPRVNEAKFDVKAWVCLSYEFDVFKVSRKILEDVTRSPDHSSDTDMVHRRLREKLTGKKFLVVLDNVWNVTLSNWEEVQKPLLFGAQGSRIIVTTRSLQVASDMLSEIRFLMLLPEDDSWELFAKYAFRDGIQLNPECREIGKKIVKKCTGLPLALKTIGSLLYNKSSVPEWETVLLNKIWELPNCDIVPALALSYIHLPSHLKTCFAYFALFRNNYEFKKEELTQLWMTENFQHHSKTPDETCQQYFNDLLSRSFFQRLGDAEELFVMHDLLNDLAKYVAGDLYFRCEDSQTNNIQKVTRHILFELPNFGRFREFGTLCKTESLRTFLPTPDRKLDYFHWFCTMSIHELFSEFKFLRILSLSHCSNLLELPDSVDNLKLLRSLDLSHTAIRKLPEKICSLFHLQILELNYCTYLEELPINLHLLTNLCRLEFRFTKIRKVPPGLEKLKNLIVMMNVFYIDHNMESGIQLLGKLNNLSEYLEIWGLECIKNPEDALEVNLKNKTHLVRLTLALERTGNSIDSKNAEVIENLQPSKNLKELSILNYGGSKFPKWLLQDSLPNLVSLVLRNCESCQHLPPLGLLPFLKKLYISGFDVIVSIDADFHGNNSSSFQSLKKLEFSDMKQWEKWVCQAVTGAFPNLQILSIKKCPKLKGHLPELLVPLKTLKITRCQQLEAFPPRTLELDLRHCGKLQLDWATMEWPRMDGHHMTALFSESDGSHTLDDLEIVEVISDDSIPLMTFPLDSFPTVKRLVLSWLRNLEMISQDQAHHDHLLDLTITRCPKFESLPGNMHMMSLTSLWIEDCPRFKSIPYGGLPSNLENLTIKGCPKFESLPDSVDNLKLLRSLDLSDTAIRKLPEKICSLSRLQILELNYCTYLEELPINLYLLTNLCRLEFRFTKVRKVPPGLEKLKNLIVIMSNFDLDLESDIQRLGKLNNLYEDLSIGELQSPSDAFEADLKNKTHIESVTLGWERTENSIDSKTAEDVLENLQPSKTLKELSIFNHGENKFPNWLLQTSIWNIVSLELDKCKSCQSLPPLGLLPFLKKLVISGFDQIVSIDADFHGKNSSSFKSLETLYFSDMRQWEKWECKVVTGAYPRLQHLSISFCPKLKGQLPEQLVPLETLHITYCEQLEAFAPRALDLELCDCGKLQLDSAMKRLVMGGHNTEASLLEMVGSNTLEHLDISSSLESMSDDCVSVRTFSLDFFPILRTLNLRGFGNLQKVLQDHAHNHLQDLTIKKCPKFESLSGIMHMLSLKSLWIEDCPRLVSFPEGGLPSNLNDMRLNNCSRLVCSLKGAFGDRSSLESLWIEGMDAECFPGEGLLPLSLTSLTICDCPNLEKLDYKGLYQLSSLRRLTLVSCPNLQCLPEEGLPRSISYLCIGDCPLLEQRCQTEGGEDWEKIAHIQNLNIL
ncbi:putative disease resistance RPP13-like protein 1 [Vigna radiata var. radiata]|uniref:Disease resistance RPP13-like protein 1 n=1 Tax=Vigna radiata var. radiata TaxID=3916 RepID=A0A1S3T728_VIGRR|nr:putative disease resistance RPP13-like protein 1 [Vigna radiata var. radiata]